MALLLLTLISFSTFSGCSKPVVICSKPKLKTVKVKHIKFSYKKAKHNYIVLIKPFDEHLRDYALTIKALNFMNKQAEIVNESK